MRRAWAVLAIITIMAAAGCRMTESVTPPPEVVVVTATPDVQATVDAGVAAAVQQTREAMPPTPKPYPTLQATPTLIPIPTSPPEPIPTPTAVIAATTVPPTATPLPAPTVLLVFPTATPEGYTEPRPTPTLPAWPTPEPRPTVTATPWPTPALWPTTTPTPWPTATPRPWPTATPEPTRAFEWFGETEYFPYEVWTKVSRARELLEQGDYQGSIRENQQALDIHDRPSAVIQNDIGLAYAELRDHNAAIRHYDRAIESRDSGVTRANRAQSYYWTGQCRMAKQDAQIALGMEEQSKGKISIHQNAHEVLWLCNESEGNTSQAIHHANEFIEFALSLRQEKISLYLASLSGLHYENSDCTQAKYAAERSIAAPVYTEPEYHSHAQAYLWLAICAADAERYTDALWHLERAYDLMHEAQYSSQEMEDVREWIEALRQLT